MVIACTDEVSPLYVILGNVSIEICPVLKAWQFVTESACLLIIADCALAQAAILGTALALIFQ